MTVANANRFDQSATMPRPGFVAELKNAFGPLQSSLQRLLTEWGSPESASELERVSSAGMTICWQVFRVAHAEDAASEARNVPTPLSLRRFLQAAKAAGVSDKTVQAVDAASRDFKAFRKRASVDNTSFRSMVLGASDSGEVEKISNADRRAAFRAQSAINGIQSDAFYFGVFVRAGATPEVSDELNLYVHDGLRRLRPDAQMRVFTYHRKPSERPDEDQPESALDQDAARKYGMPILSRFSTQPMPAVEKIELASGTTSYCLLGEEVGTHGAITCTFARNTPNAPLMKDPDGRLLYHASRNYLSQPTAMGIQELFLHRASFPNAKPEVMVYQFNSDDSSQRAAKASQQLPIGERLLKFGRASAAAAPANLPQWSEMTRYAIEKVGWELSEFDLYRLEMPYPIAPSTARIYFYVD